MENRKFKLQISFLDTGEFRIMHLKSDNVEVMMGIETDDIINVIFEYSSKKYQEGLETKKRRSDLYLKVLIYCVMVFIK